MVDREGRPLEAVMGNEHGELAVEVKTCPISTRRALAELIQWLGGSCSTSTSRRGGPYEPALSEAVRDA